MDKLTEFKEFLAKISRYMQAVSLMQWDLETYAPKMAVEYRSKAMGELSELYFRSYVSDKTEKFLEELSKKEVYDNLDQVGKALVKVTKEDYEKMKKIPPELIRKLTETTTKANSAWKEAREKAEFFIFEPLLEEIVSLTKEVAEKLGYQENRYDALLDLYEPGLKTKKLKDTIDYLKKNMLPFIDELFEKGKEPRSDFFEGNFSIEKQKELSKEALKFMKFDFNTGRMDISAHPFTTKIGPRDVRVTTRFSEKDIRYSLFSTIHEGGHALYELHIPEIFFETPLDEGASMAVHESQSRFWENIIGRGPDFWVYFSKKLKEIFPDFENVSSMELYKAVNIVKKSFVRTDADEVTYNFHIMLRFEIEEALINDRIKVKELPSIWNEKMNEYFGMVPPNDALGVLQDVHWSNGSFGYFPSYMLGNLYAAQFFNKLKKDVTDYNTQLGEGNATGVLNWLVENVHKYGKMYKPEELLEKITGETLNPKYFVDYIKEKFSDIYEL
ncbi:carboxypeptidase M32 [Petrotoga sp. 9PWA.NaAc.5.4]|uniref:carboxypeptidase M32 n=1 Tax=Petrotoga sp. 9PWA.NaAc.5.4 TaxID=1434328 RepID=UPI000CC349DB|nr:carboxypeptidase M32 [Petrotoga sp. 9PWA.NaAc.5.4]PNR96296.1 peptidase M32 [Petrotoga sp. 9PWA.NaAc.5.4]